MQISSLLLSSASSLAEAAEAAEAQQKMHGVVYSAPF